MTYLQPINARDVDGLNELLWANPNLFAVFDTSDRLILANEAFREAYFADPPAKPFGESSCVKIIFTAGDL